MTATDRGPGTPLSATSTFAINILPLDQAPVAKDDSYTILENAVLSVGKANAGVLANDADADAGDAIQARLVKGPSHGTLTLTSAGTFTYTPTTNYNGPDSFTYVAVDNFLKTSNVATATITVTPAVHALSAHLVNDSGASAIDLITGDATLTGRGYFNAAVFASVDGAAPVRIATADATGAWTGKPVLSDGTHTIVVSETDGDPASRTFGRTDTVTTSFTLDTTPPPLTATLVSDTGASSTDGITKNSAIAGVSDPGTSTSVSIKVDNNPAVSVATNAATGAWSYSPALADGIHTFVVTGDTDIAGNTASQTLTITLDTTAPSLTEALLRDTGASSTDRVTNDDTITGSGDPSATVLASIDGSAYAPVTAADAAGTWSFKPVLADGTHTVAVRETDLAGNQADKSLSFTLDTTPPPVTVALLQDTGASATDGVTSNGTLTGTGDPNASVVVSVDGSVAATVVTDAAGRWSFNPFANNLNHGFDGKHLISVAGTDLAGNSKTASTAITLDTTPPATPAFGAFTYTVNTATNVLAAYTFSGTAEAGATVVLSNGTTLGTVTAAAIGAWSFTTGLGAAGLSNVNQTLSVTAADLAGNASASLAQGLIVGAAGSQTLSATNVSTVLLGLAGADILRGGSGNDILDGGANGDAMSGGSGDDTYIVDQNGDTVTEAPNAGIDTVLASVNFTLGADVENLTFTGAGGFTGTGNTLANSITGGAGNDTLSDGGVGGNDTLTGLGGNDTYVVTNAGDAIVEAAGGGTDTIRTTLNTYSLAGAANVENLTYTGAGAFTGTGNALANTLTGGAGNDTLDGGVNTAGGDTLIGGIGSDTYVVRNATDVVTEGAGLTGDVDTVNAFINTYTLASNVENLTFLGAGSFTGTGNAGNNVITGGAGADTLSGAGGSDTLIGGAGADTLTGGAGVDAFFLAKGDANGDLITDFNRGADQILLSGYAAGAVLAKTVTGTATTPTSYAVQVGGVTVDTFKLTGTITLAVNTDYRFV